MDKLTTEEYYNKKIKPFMRDDTVNYKGLSFFRKTELYFMARAYNKKGDL